MGGSTKQTTSSNSVSTYRPTDEAMRAYQGLFQQARDVTSTPYNSGMDYQVADLSPQQMQAFESVGNIQGAYAPYIDTASGYTSEAAAPSYENVNKYFNPYKDDILANLAETQRQQQQQVVGNAISQGALGGGMVKGAQSELARQQGLATGATLADLYDRAVGAYNTDAARKLQAGQQMAGLGQLQQALGLQGAEALYNAGSAQQQQWQNVLNAATTNAQQRSAYPIKMLEILGNVYGSIGSLMGGTTEQKGTSTSKQKTSGLGSIAGPVFAGLSLFADGGEVPDHAGSSWSVPSIMPEQQIWVPQFGGIEVNKPMFPEAANISQPQNGGGGGGNMSLGDWMKLGENAKPGFGKLTKMLGFADGGEVLAPNITSGGGFESGTTDRIKSLFNISPDTGGSRSFGSLGLNTLPGNSAWEFLKEFGGKLGITAKPDTSEFADQWKAVATDNPHDLIAAEDAYYKKHVASPAVSGLKKVGLPQNVVNDPRVRAFASDRVDQYGSGLAFGKTHASRWRNAYEASDGDIGKMLRTMAAYDSSGIDTDFKSYLSEHPDHANGLRNRISKRLNAALNIGGADSVRDDGGDIQSKYVYSGGYDSAPITKTTDIGEVGPWITKTTDIGDVGARVDGVAPFFPGVTGNVDRMILPPLPGGNPKRIAAQNEVSPIDFPPLPDGNPKRIAAQNEVSPIDFPPLPNGNPKRIAAQNEVSPIDFPPLPTRRSQQDNGRYTYSGPIKSVSYVGDVGNPTEEQMSSGGMLRRQFDTTPPKPSGIYTYNGPITRTTATGEVGSPTQEQLSRGGLLKRLFGANFNPLSLTDNDRKAMLVAGLSMMSSGDIGRGGIEGIKFGEALRAANAKAKNDALTRALRTAQLQREQRGSSQVVDFKSIGQHGQPIIRKALVNKDSGEITPLSAPGMDVSGGIGATSPVQIASPSGAAPQSGVYRAPQTSGALQVSDIGEIGASASEQLPAAQQPAGEEAPRGTQATSVPWGGKIPVGFVQKQLSDGRFLENANGSAPILETKAMAEARGKMAEEQNKAGLKKKESMPDDAYKLRDTIGGIDDTFIQANDLISDPATRTATELPFGGELSAFGHSVNIADVYPGTSTADAFNRHKAIIASVALRTMERLKSQSKTGATGFGQLSNAELKILQDSIGNLRLSSRYEELVKNYRHFQDILLRTRENVIRRYKEHYGSVPEDIRSKNDLINMATESAIEGAKVPVRRPRTIPLDPFGAYEFAIPLTSKEVRAN